MEKNLKILEFDNNLKCYIKNFENKLNYIYFTLVVKCGSLDDDIYFGEAHFLEHMLLEFNRKNVYNDILYKITGTTSLDKTIFMLACENNSNAIEKILMMIGNIIQGEYLFQGDIERVREDIIKEYNIEVLNKNSYSNMYKRLFELSKTAKALPIGNLEDIQKITCKDIYNYFKKNYLIKNMALLVVGNIELNNMLKKIRSLERVNFREKLNYENEKLNYENEKLKKEEKITIQTNIQCNTEIHMFLIINQIQNNIKSDLIESILITFVYEIVSKLNFDYFENINFEINKFSNEKKFIHFKISKKYQSKNYIKYLKKCCFKIQDYLLKDECSLILKEIFEAYYNFFSNNEKIDINDYINHLIENFLYNKQLYTNKELLIILNEITISDIIMNLKIYINNIIKNKDIYFFYV